MAQAEMVEEQMNVPDGGIAELVMDDQTADAVYDEEEAAPEGGIAQFKTVAEQMAAMGREGDNMLAHLESGELVIPTVVGGNLRQVLQQWIVTGKPPSGAASSSS